MADRSDCAELVRQQDSDRYLTALFAPPERREDLFALYAFNAEVARGREAVSEPMLGHIRLQWWRESVEGIYAGRPRRHEVVTPLARAVRDCGLTRAHFDRLIDAREADLLPDPPESLAALEAYAESTSSTLVWLALEALGVRDTESREAGRRLGIAWSMIGLLRALPFHAKSARCYLPADLMAETGVDLNAVLAGRSEPALRVAVARLAGVASRHLDEARAASLPRASRPALLSARLAGRSLQLLEGAGYDPYKARAEAPQTGKAWRLLISAISGRL